MYMKLEKQGNPMLHSSCNSAFLDLAAQVQEWPITLL